MTQRNTFLYNPKVEATTNNREEKEKEFNEIRKNAPKVTDHRDRDVTVNHSFVIAGGTMDISALLAQHGIHPPVSKPIKQNNTDLLNKEVNSSPSPFKKT